MARGISRLPIINLCPNLIGSRIRFRSSTFGSKLELPNVNKDQNDGMELKECHGRESDNVKEQIKGRKVMVVVDSSQEAKTALHWALSHVVQPDDTVVLLDVVKPSITGEKTEKSGEENQRLHAMKSICQVKRPEVQVELSLVEGKVRGPAIVEAAKNTRISLLVIGHKKRPITMRLVMIWAAGGRSICDTAEYCVQNATCMVLAVRKKSKKGSGYLITTKRLKDFWLLA